ncbi:MAG: phosphatidylserine decarboxylase [Deltaproteobacteria bacterium]|nr:phosphatidylserine decarboxylase [Deltaproteobacteria bacterium]
MGFSDQLFIGALGLVPKKALSHAVRGLAQIRAKPAVRAFASTFGIDVAEAEHEIDTYGSVLDFFTRRLKPDARPLDQDPDAILSPADGTFDAHGLVEEGRLFQAKGREYTLAALLADEERARRYEGGRYATVYLSPRDYHWVHSPADARVVGATYVPGQLWPVNRPSVRVVDQLFAKNERLITHLETDRFGPMELVMVGATCVGRIRTTYDESLTTNAGKDELERRTYQTARALGRGDPLGVFEFGSTVVLVLARGAELDELEVGSGIHMGQAIGRKKR